VKNKEIIEQTYLEARDKILKSKHPSTPRIDRITAEILQKVGPDLWRRIHSLIKLYGIRKKYR
jgi:hypothetical protein